METKQQMEKSQENLFQHRNQLAVAILTTEKRDNPGNVSLPYQTLKHLQEKCGTLKKSKK